MSASVTINPMNHKMAFVMENFDGLSPEEIMAYLAALPDKKVRRALSTIMRTEISLSSDEYFRLFQLIFADERYFTSLGLDDLLGWFLVINFSEKQKQEVIATLVRCIDEIELVSCFGIGVYIAVELPYTQALSLLTEFVHRNTANTLDTANCGLEILLKMHQRDLYDEEIEHLKNLYQRTLQGVTEK